MEACELMTPFALDIQYIHFNFEYHYQWLYVNLFLGYLYASALFNM